MKFIVICLSVLLSACVQEKPPVILYNRGEMYDKWQTSVLDMCAVESVQLSILMKQSNVELDIDRLYRFLYDGCLKNSNITI